MSRNKVIVFSSHTHVLPFTVDECLVGDVAGRSTSFVRPLPCTCRMAAGFDEWMNEGDLECASCYSTERAVRISAPDWCHLSLNQFAVPSDREEVRTLVLGLSPECPEMFEADGIPVGKIALFDVLIKHKWDSLAFSNNQKEWDELRSLVVGCLLVGKWMRRMLQTDKNMSLVVFNYPYSFNRMACHIAEQENVPVYSVTGGMSLSRVWETMIIARGTTDQCWLSSQRNWAEGFRDRVLDPGEVQLVGEHFDELFAAKNAHAYSSSPGSGSCASVFKRINPDGTRQILLAATSSSDERFAGEQSGIRTIYPPEADLFPTHKEWLEFLIERVRHRADLALIIRVHPREFPNKREVKMSMNAQRMKDLLIDLPPNIVVNWPEDEISFYDLMLRADLVLTCWSSVSLEASLFGSPIILPNNPIAVYRGIADKVCRETEEYWTAIKEGLQAPWSLQRSIKTFRWYWLIQFGGAIDLRGGTPMKKSRKLLALSVLEFSYRLARRVRLPLPSLPDRWKLPGAEFRSLLQRPGKFCGESAIKATLEGHFDPMECYGSLLEMQGKRGIREPAQAGEEGEENAVRGEVRRLFHILTSLQSVNGGGFRKIVKMLDAREASI